MCRPFQYVAILDIGCAGVLTLSDVWCMYGHVADLDLPACPSSRGSMSRGVQFCFTNSVEIFQNCIIYRAIKCIGSFNYHAYH